MKKIVIQTIQWLFLTMLFAAVFPAFTLMVWCLTFGGFSLSECFHSPTYIAIQGFLTFVAMIGAGAYMESEL